MGQKYQYGLDYEKYIRECQTFAVNLLTKPCKSSLETFAGRFTAGASGVPSSSETNWTTIFGEGATGTGSGSGIP